MIIGTQVTKFDSDTMNTGDCAHVQHYRVVHTINTSKGSPKVL